MCPTLLSKGMFGRLYSTGTRGIFGGRADGTEVSGTGIEFLPSTYPYPRYHA